MVRIYFLVALDSLPETVNMTLTAYPKTSTVLVWHPLALIIIHHRADATKTLSLLRPWRWDHFIVIAIDIDYIKLSVRI
jgi:hypothetical protein